MHTQPFKSMLFAFSLHVLKKPKERLFEIIYDNSKDQRIKINKNNNKKKNKTFVAGFTGSESPVAGCAPFLPLQCLSVAPPLGFMQASDWLTQLFCDVRGIWALYLASHYQKRTISLSPSPIPK